MAKTIAFGGSRFIFCGRDGDPYYDNLEQHGITCNEIELAARILERDSIVFDVGANIGLTTLAFASIATGGRVFSFEPLPSSFQYLEQNLFANGVASGRIGRIEALNVACGSTRAPGRLFEDSFSAGSFLISNPTGELGRSGVAVDVFRLDDVARNQALRRVDFVKIDVEGFELDVLDGMQEVLEKFRPIVCLEFNSFCLIANAGVLPTLFLSRLCAQFERVALVSGSGLQLLDGPGERRAALVTNLIHHGSVDSLICFPKAQQYEAALRRSDWLGLDARPTYVARANEKGGVTVNLSQSFAGDGWCGRELWGAWSEERSASIHVDLRALQGRECELRVWAQAFLPPDQSTEKVVMTVNDEPLATWDLGQSMAQPHTAYMRSSLASRRNPVTIVFRRQDEQAIPQGVGNAGWRRGIACRCIEINPVGAFT